MLVPPDLFRTLASLAETRSFTGTALALGVRQSTVSQHVARLEAQIGRRLIDRDTHAVALTASGAAVLEFGRKILAANRDLEAWAQGARLRGRLRFGACEDFVVSGLPDVLAAFQRAYPEVDLEFTVGLSVDLYEAYDAGRLDVVFVKRRPRDTRGSLAWREAVVWTSRPGFRLEPDAPLPLILFPAPSITRAMVIEALDRSRQAWRTAFTSGNMIALTAAARAGVGVLPHSRRLLPAGLAVIEDDRLPWLGDVEFVVVGADGANPLTQAVAQAVLQWSGGRLA